MNPPIPAPLPEEWLTVNAAAAEVGVSRRTVYNWMKAGKVTTKRTAGGNVRILAASLYREAP